MHYTRRNKLHNFEDLKLHNIWMEISISRGFANWDQMCWSLDCTTGVESMRQTAQHFFYSI
jgi:hypothetical protein